MPRRADTWKMGKPHRREPSDTRLAEWAKEAGLSIPSLSRQLGVGRMVAYWLNGQSIPPLVWAYKIEKFTKGEVPASSWLETPLAMRMWKAEGSAATK